MSNISRSVSVTTPGAGLCMDGLKRLRDSSLLMDSTILNRLAVFPAHKESALGFFESFFLTGRIGIVKLTYG